jgi:hypothetical protein
MALQYSPKIVTDNLVMCLDASQNKSYPTTDLPVKGGLVMWMDAADDTTFSYSSGTTVSQWRDKSGFNYHMVPVSAGPTRNAFLNSRKVIACTTSQQIWNSSINLVTSAYTIFCVTRLSGINPNRVLSTLYTGATGTNWLLGHWGGHYNQYYAEGWVQYQGYPADNTWRMYMGDWSGSSTDLANLYSNGTAIATNSNQASVGPLGLGINISSEVSTCEAAEIVVFNRVLSTTERNLIHTYLGQKWGISNTDRRIIDLSGNNNNGLFGDGTIANMPDYDFYNKGALTFNSTNSDRVVFSLNSSINITNNITLECFVNVNTFNAVGGIITFGTASGEQYSLWTNPSPSAIYFGTNWPSDWQTGRTLTALNSNVWYHITATFISGNWRIYLNGILDNSGTFNISTLPVVSSAYLTLGVNHPGGQEYLNGKIGNVKIYNKALSAAEVAQNYNAQKSKFIHTLVQQGMTLSLDAGNPYSYAGAGFSWYDVSGNSYICTLINGPTYNNGTIVFDGTNDFVDLTYPFSVPIAVSGNAVRSMFAWVRTTSTGNQAFISTGTAASSQSFNLVKYGSYIGVMGYNNDYYPSTGNAGILITDDVWHYIGVTFDGTNLRMYVDGILDNTSGTLTYSTTGQNNFIGKSSHTGNENYTNGSMGMVHVYNRALSGAEVLQNYNATKGRFGR